MCPHCYNHPLEKYNGDQQYEMGAYDIGESIKIKCSHCEVEIIMRPQESIDWDFEEIEEEK